MKKLVSLILAIMMIAAVGASWAATDVYSGSNQTEATSVAGNATIPITKGIIFFNANGSNVYEPNVTYTYAVAPASIAAAGTDATVTDDASTHDPAVAVQRNVYPGPNGGVTGTTIAFAANTTNGTHGAAANGTEVERTSNLSLDITQFTKPGIYRYIITESVTSPSSGNNSERLQAAGMAARDTGYDNTRYLDVYIRNKADGTGLEMYGAVIFKTTESSGEEGKDDITTSTKKTTGFEPNPTGDSTITYANDPNVDKYYTYDFTVKKTVSGSMADKAHEFPFYVSISNSINGAMFTYTADGSETFTGATNASGVVTLTAANFSIGSDAKTSNLTLKHNDTIVLVGLPSNQTTDLAVVIKEFNDTYDSYTPSASATHGSLTMTTGTAMAAQTGSDTTGSFAVKGNDGESQVLAIDNKLTEISPTGYVSRFAPYALILIGGVALLVIAMKRRKHTEED